MDLTPKLLKKMLGDGGAGLDKSNGIDSLYDVLKGMQDQARNRVLEGLSTGAPTTPSAQLTGVGGTLTVRINVTAGALIVDGSQRRFAAQADLVLFGPAAYWSAITGRSGVFSVIAKKDAAGVVTFIGVAGPEAATGAQQPPSRAAIQGAVGANLHWIKVADVTVNRTGDLTVTQTQDDTQGDFGTQGVNIE